MGKGEHENHVAKTSIFKSEGREKVKAYIPKKS